MSRFLHAVQGDLKLVHMHKEPPDLHGAPPVPVILTKSTKHVEVFARRGSPFSLSDLGEFYNCRLIVQFSNMCYVQPAFIGAARNLSTVGINDRLRLACVVSFFFPLFLFALNCLLQLEILTLMSRLPDDSIRATQFQQFFIDIREFYTIYWLCLFRNNYPNLRADEPISVYKDPSHPPTGYL